MAASRPVSLRVRQAVLTLLGLVTAAALIALGSAGVAQAATGATGELDCNGFSPVQQSIDSSAACTDIRGFAGVNNANNWDSRFYDNGHYIGHDEPDMTFLSTRPGSGNDVTWIESIPHDPSAPPTDKTPGSDVAHWFELSLAPWFSMDMCDPSSYPQASCTPGSDSNAADPCTISANPCPNGFTGGGSAFMELQFYPPGFAPFDDAVSCDNTHWCSALTIDSLECTYEFATCNGNCEEPVNFAYIQHNGVPAGAPSPQNADLSTFTPNSQTLLMNPGDTVVVHMFDAPVPRQGGVRAFEVVIDDLTTHQSGFMQASAANGFMNSSITDCSGKPFNFEPEYNTAREQNIAPWTALRTDISTQFETGHFEPCTSVTNPITLSLFGEATDQDFTTCNGPYEDAAPGGDGSSDPEMSDASCFPQGDTHGSLNTAPDETTGCLANLFQNGDLHFDGTPYWPEWPVGPVPTRTLPGSFVQALPATAGHQYPSFFLQTDLALSESTCQGNSVAPGGTLAGCAVPAPNSPGKFYPYWSRAGFGGACVLEFGNVSSGFGVNDLGKDAQYGTNQEATLGYPEFLGPVQRNTCGSGPSRRS